MSEVISYQQLLDKLESLQASYGVKTAQLNETVAKLRDTQFELEEAKDTIEAIRSGDIDALIVKSPDGHQLYTLKNADQSYRIFIEQMTEGAVTLNSAGLILYCNSQFGTLVGQPIERVIGSSFDNYLSKSSRERYYQILAKAWEKSVKGELILTGSHQPEISVLVSLKTLNLGDVLSMSMIVTDLTEQRDVQQLLLQKNQELEYAKKVAEYLNGTLEQTVKLRTKDLEKSIEDKIVVEQALRSNQEQLTRILETMAEGVSILNTAGQLMYANPMAKKILGLDEIPEGSGMYYDPHWPQFKVDGSPLPDQEHPMRLIMAGEKLIVDYEIGIEPPGRERFFISMNAAPIHDDQGNIAAGVVTFMDVTHRRKAIQHKDEFISVASHELKTPITSLKASLQLLDRIKTAPTAMLPRLIDQANKSLNRVGILIDDLLNATKITEGQLELKKKRVILSELLEESCPEVRANGEFSIRIQGDLNVAVHIDPDKIDQVITNLINNAIKYAPDSKEILVDIQTSGSMSEVRIIDKGPGIPSDKLPHLFHRYFRVDNSGASYSGLGLGLYISSEIIKQHNGQIGAESILGKGSIFWFTLPVAENE